MPVSFAMQILAMESDCGPVAALAGAVPFGVLTVTVVTIGTRKSILSSTSLHSLSVVN